MQEILEDISVVVGVTGCFVCDTEGKILSSSLSADLGQDDLATVGRTITQTTAGLTTARRRKVHEIDLLFSGGRVVVKPLREGCLCILCSRQINVPLLNLTANVAVRKLSGAMKEKAPVPTQDDTQPTPPEEPSYRLLEAYPDIVRPVIDYETTLPEHQRADSMTALGHRVGTMLFQRRYSSLRVPRSTKQALDLVVVPAVSPFAIATAQGDTLNVLLCPFCRNISSASPRCHFLAGFVEGLVNSVSGLEGVRVEETLCRGRGDDTCTFVASMQG
jgi:predicted hydrocarbon binding protein/predicted regulator of Ras-like GTPase activity (Roadblock/LC7/MglB family)